jgi:hypothetical protein
MQRIASAAAPVIGALACNSTRSESSLLVGPSVRAPMAELGTPEANWAGMRWLQRRRASLDRRLSMTVLKST